MTHLKDVLKEPLVFGNSSQIAELRRLEKEAIEREENSKKDTWEVTVNFSGCYKVEVQASDEEEAIELAEEEGFCMDDADMDIESKSARMIKKWIRE